MKIVRLHKIGETMTEGIITQWFQKEGAEIKKGDPLFELETEKLTTTIESVEEGTLLKIVTAAGETVPINTALAVIGKPGEEIPPLETVDSRVESAMATATQAPSVTPSSGGVTRILISPVAKKLAKEHNIDISTIKGTGPRGRIVIEDVQKAIEAGGAAAGPGIKVSKVESLSQLRKTIARNLKQSISTAVHSMVTSEVNCDALVTYRNEIVDNFEKSHGFRITYTDLLLKFAVESLKSHPELNSSFTEAGIRIYEPINLGVAVGKDEGLIVPVIHSAQEKSTVELAKTRKEIVQRIMDNKGTIDDLSNGTFTLTNLGMFSVDVFTPVINYPQVAILGVGRIKKVPVIKDNQISIGNVMVLGLTFDHRAIDGVQAARFLETFIEMVEDPAKYAPI